eukprot:scaffold11198_cov103-Skeletonema_dohrnii-CCMP3373.AAC.4
MEPRSTTRNAAVKDALTLLRREECAGGMEQRSNYAAAKDAQINPNLEECALSMGQHRSSTTDATVKDAQRKFIEVDYVVGIDQAALLATIHCFWIRIREDCCDSNSTP